MQHYFSMFCFGIIESNICNDIRPVIKLNILLIHVCCLTTIFDPFHEVSSTEKSPYYRRWNLPRIPRRIVLTYGPTGAITLVIMPTIPDFISQTILVTPEVVWLAWSVPIIVGKLFPNVAPHIHTFLCYIRGPQPKFFSLNQPQLVWNRTIN